MKKKPQAVRVALIQATPVYLDLAASVRKAIGLMQRAARKGAKLVAFGETWLPGYPAWLDYCPAAALWNHKPVKQVFARLRQNSVNVPGKEVAALARAARKLGITLVMGVNERVDAGPGNGTLYNALLTITPDGRLANHHRKLVPTYTERMVWGQGDGSGLEAAETPVGRVGRTGLLGALDAAGAPGAAQLRRAHPRGGVAHRARSASSGQPPLRLRRTLLRAVCGPHHAGPRPAP
jgi:predicted amidohydrolase